MKIEPIRKVSVGEQVYEQLKENLIDGIWKPGERLPSENELSNLMGVSRVTVRQALSKLIALGILETRPGEGNFAKELTIGSYIQEMIPYMKRDQDSMAEVLQFRLILDVGTVEIACRNASDKDIEHLKESLRRMGEVKSDIVKYSEEDLRFHMLITKMSKNSMITQVAYIVRDIIRDSVQKVTKEIGVDNGLNYHKKIIEAFEKKDTIQARQSMQEHLENALERYMSSNVEAMI